VTAAVLLDVNVLVALVADTHVHHAEARRWFRQGGGPFATCPITQGGLIRFLVREGQPAAGARATVGSLAAHPRHLFWPDDLSFADATLSGVVGHRQVTDAYLAELARAHEGKVATFDQGFAAAFPAAVELVGDAAGAR
jgi:toxin-antitoxin system PIN domain toxin